MPAYTVGAMHDLIGARLEDCARGATRRLIIEAPRRHGKSELASKRFPAWYIGSRPDKQIICCSYAADLASDFGRDVRNIVSSDAYTSVFPAAQLSADSQAAGRWHTREGGVYVAAGVGGPVAGRGADLLLIDDPIKNRQEAESETIRDNVWDWFRSVAYPTLMPDGCIVIITTRWHEDDLVGRLLELQGDQWERVTLPALSEGRALSPERYPVEALEEIRSTIGDREWNAQYQQNPTPDEGAYFQRSWVQWYRDVGRLVDNSPLAIYVASDFALTDNGGDYTVHLVVGVNPGGHWFVLDMWRGQVDALEAVDQGLALIRQWKPLVWFGEKVSITKAIGPFLRKRMQETSTFVRIEEIAPVADKATRARPIQGRMQMGLVHLPESAAFTPDLVSELLSFPLGRNDDQVDCLSMLGLGLDSITGAGKPRRRPDYKPWHSDTVMEMVEGNGNAIGTGRYGRNGR